MVRYSATCLHFHSSNFILLLMWLLICLVSSCSILWIFYQHFIQNKKRSNSDGPSAVDWNLLKRKWLVVFLLANGSDWLQGPYVYALYESYGMTSFQTATLFMFGFLSSMIFGTFAGSLADIHGRKLLAMFCCFVSMLSCATKLVARFEVLVLGRILAGISTSLLFSVFESWIVHQHHHEGHSQTLLDNLFGWSVLLNGLGAVFSGLVASFFSAFFGFVSPFIVSFFILLVTWIIIWRTWDENYGVVGRNALDNLNIGFAAVWNDTKVLVIGMVQSLYESSMYIFVYLWTPTLAAGEQEFHQQSTSIHGLVFSAFMIAIMLGSSLFGKFQTRSSLKIESLLMWTITVAAITFIIPVFSSNAPINFLCFFIFEICCGVYFPSMGSLRSIHLPETSRTTIMNIFRLLLNALVIAALLLSGILTLQLMFAMNVVALFMAAILVLKFLINSREIAIETELPFH